MTLDEYRKSFSDEDAVGWMALDGALSQLYQEQKPRHYPSALPPMLSPLSGVNVYDSKMKKSHLHYVSYGMSELFYNEEALGKEFSKWGFEFTCRVVHKPNEDDPQWLIQLIYKLADYVYKSGRWFEKNQLIPMKMFGIISKDIKAIAFDVDSELGIIETPHGKVSFLQMIALNQDQFKTLGEAPTSNDVGKLLTKLKKDDPFLIMKDISNPG